MPSAMMAGMLTLVLAVCAGILPHADGQAASVYTHVQVACDDSNPCTVTVTLRGETQDQTPGRNYSETSTTLLPAPVAISPDMPAPAPLLLPPSEAGSAQLQQPTQPLTKPPTESGNPSSSQQPTNVVANPQQDLPAPTSSNPKPVETPPALPSPSPPPVDPASPPFQPMSNPDATPSTPPPAAATPAADATTTTQPATATGTPTTPYTAPPPPSTTKPAQSTPATMQVLPQPAQDANSNNATATATATATASSGTEARHVTGSTTPTTIQRSDGTTAAADALLKSSLPGSNNTAAVATMNNASGSNPSHSNTLTYLIVGVAGAAVTACLAVAAAHVARRIKSRVDTAGGEGGYSHYSDEASPPDSSGTGGRADVCGGKQRGSRSQVAIDKRPLRHEVVNMSQFDDVQQHKQQQLEVVKAGGAVVVTVELQRSSCDSSSSSSSRGTDLLGLDELRTI